VSKWATHCTRIRSVIATITLSSLLACGGGTGNVSVRFKRVTSEVPTVEDPPPDPSVTPTEATTPEPSTTPTETTTPEPSTTPTETTTPEPSTTPTETTTPEPSTTPTETTTPEPSTTPTETTTPEPSGTPTFLPTPTSSPLELSSTFYFESLQIPVRAIELVGSAVSSEVYYCDADTNDSCMVEWNSELGADTLLGREIAVDPGTYQEIVVHTCFDEGSYELSVRGSADIGESTYVTQAEGVPAIDSIAQDSRIEVASCQYSVPLPTPITVEKGSSTSLSVFYDLRNMAWIGLLSSAMSSQTPAPWSASGCTGKLNGNYDPAAGAYVCASFPLMYPKVGEAPVLERYRINNRAILGIYFESSDYYVGTKTPIGGYLRRYYGPETVAGVDFGFDVPLKTISKNVDGTYSIESYGATATSTPYFESQDFPGDLTPTDKPGGNGTFTGVLSGATSNPFLAERLE
jgi:hypothetical protein